eukprot:gene2651-5552_t
MDNEHDDDISRALPDVVKRIEVANQNIAASNFWHVGIYKRATQRLDAGGILLNDFSHLVLERAYIERKYAQMLAAFSKKWHEKIQKGHEETEGTLKPAWFALLTEADQLNEIHTANETNLTQGVHAEVCEWRKSNFRRQLRTCRIAKLTPIWTSSICSMSFIVCALRPERKFHSKFLREANDKFFKAQKPWAKRMRMYKKAKSTYYSACQTRDNIQSKLEDFSKLTSIKDTTEEERGKLRGKLVKAKSIVNDARKAYIDRISELNQDKSRYEADMNEAFNMCQEIEHRREQFLKEMMRKYYDILRKHTPFQCQDMEQPIEAINADEDIARYHKNKGTGMPLVIPPFQEFGEKPMIQIIVDESIADRLPMETCEITPDLSNEPAVNPRQEDVIEEDDEFDDEEEEEEDEDWDTDEPARPLTDSTAGRLVCALYDYAAEDQEEISLTKGDVIRLIDEEDEQGWARGITADGRNGLFPACYVEDVPVPSEPTEC